MRSSGPRKYRKLDPPVEALLWDGNNKQEFIDWLGEHNIQTLDHNPRLIRVRRNSVFHWNGILTGQYAVVTGKESQNVISFDADIFERSYSLIGSVVPEQRSGRNS